MHKVGKLIRSENINLVQIIGDAGIGKTTLAKRVGQWLEERPGFAHGIIFIKLTPKDKMVVNIITKLFDSLQK